MSAILQTFADAHRHSRMFTDLRKPSKTYVNCCGLPHINLEELLRTFENLRREDLRTFADVREYLRYGVHSRASAIWRTFTNVCDMADVRERPRCDGHSPTSSIWRTFANIHNPPRTFAEDCGCSRMCVRILANVRDSPQTSATDTGGYS